MKTIVVVAYYHILHAIERALEMEEKPALVVCTDYTKMEDSLVDKLRESGVFHTVIKTDSREFLDDFLAELRKTKKMDNSEIKEIGTSLFDEYIDNYYYPKFEGLDFDDDVYIYTDYHVILYSINKHFKSIILCEDGYKVLYKRYKTYELRGYFKLIDTFIQIGAYPKMQFGCEKITGYLCSGDYEELPKRMREKVTVWDYKEAVDNNHQQYSEAIQGIFSIGDIEVRDGAILLIEQPLYRTHFCNDVGYFLFYKKLLRELSKDHQVIIKPHPAGTKSIDVFEDEDIKAIPKWIPAECLNYTGTEFDDIVTFNSAALGLLENTKHHTALYSPKKIKTDSVKSYIRGYISGEYIDIGLYLYYRNFPDDVLDDLQLYYENNQRFRFHLNIITPEKKVAKAKEVVEKVKKKNNVTIGIFPVASFDQDEIMRIMINHHEGYDYTVTVTGENEAKDVKTALKKFCKGSMAHCVGIHHRGERNVVICNPLGEHMLMGSVNVLWSKHILQELKEHQVDTALQAVQYVYENKVSTDAVRQEYLATSEKCRNFIGKMGEQCDNEELADVFRAYSLILNDFYDSKKMQIDVFKAQSTCFDDDSVVNKEVFFKVLLAALREERKLRIKHFSRVRRLEKRGSVQMALKFIVLKKRIKKYNERMVKKVKK